MKKRLIFAVFISLFLVVNASEKYAVEVQSLVYKEVDGNKLEMTLYKPVVPEGKQLPAIVFFFGGGWIRGDKDHFKMQARYLASRGMVACCPDYRVKSRQGTSPFESVMDAKSALRYVKENAIELGIDSAKVVSSGGSAGGHLAACTALIKDFNEDTDNLSVSPVPIALVLHNPGINTAGGSEGRIKKFLGKGIEISPLHNVAKGLPPTLILSGEEDTTTPFDDMLNFQKIMLEKGNKCKVVGYKGQTHGFFNYDKSPEHFKLTLREAELFLEKLGLLSGESWLNEYYRNIKK